MIGETTSHTWMIDFGKTLHLKTVNFINDEKSDNVFKTLLKSISHNFILYNLFMSVIFLIIASVQVNKTSNTGENMSSYKKFMKAIYNFGGDGGVGGVGGERGEGGEGLEMFKMNSKQLKPLTEKYEEKEKTEEKEKDNNNEYFLLFCCVCWVICSLAWFGTSMSYPDGEKHEGEKI